MIEETLDLQEFLVSLALLEHREDKVKLVLVVPLVDLDLLFPDNPD